MFETDLGRIHAELLGELVEVHLEREPRLGGAMAALGTAWRLVREDSCALKPVTWNVIGDRLQRPCVVRAGDSVGPVTAAVEQRLEVHARDGAVFVDARLHPHERGMAPAVTVEDFLARERDLTGRPVSIASFAATIS